jgi:hypothetical protein
MILMTITDYAATHNAQRQAAKKWADKGALVMVGAKVDAEASDVRMKAADLGRFRLRAHGGRRAAGVHGKVDRPAMTDTATLAERAFAEEYPHLVRARSAIPNGCVATIERIACPEAPDEIELFEMLDAIALGDFEADAEMAEWHRWPTRIAASVAKELGIPKRADALEAALRRRIIERLERELLIDAEVYLAGPSELHGIGQTK